VSDACPISTGGGTRRVHLVRGGGGASARAHHWTTMDSPLQSACSFSPEPNSRSCRVRRTSALGVRAALDVLALRALLHGDAVVVASERGED